MSLHRSRERQGRLPVMCVADRNYTTRRQYTVRIYILYIYLFIYIANGVSLLLFFSGIVFIIFASYVLGCCCASSISLLSFLLSFFFWLLLIYRSAIDPAIHSGGLTNIHFILVLVLFLYSQSCHFSIDSYSPKLFLPPKNFPLLLFLSFMSVASFEIFNKKKGK